MLQGVKVVEFATYVAGPSAAAVLSDWGAEVIKVERSTGDPTRALFESQPELSGNPVFEFENHGKRGVVLDIAKAEGREALLRILKGADIFITNLRPGGLERARLDYASLKDVLPGLIYCSVSGYGLEGPARDLPAFDISALWTRSGLAASCIPEGVDPFPCRPGMGDAFCALATASAVLAALHEKGRTGKGRLVETSLLRAGTYALGWDLSIQLKWGQFTATQQRRRAVSPLSNYYRTADGRWFVLIARSPDDWPRIAGALGLDHLIEDERYFTVEARKEHSPALIAELDAVIREMTLEEVQGRLNGADQMWAPLQTLAEVAADPLFEAAGCFQAATDASGEPYPIPASPARFPGLATAPGRPAPKLGQHTRQVLREAGYSAGAIDELLASGAAFQAEDVN